MSNPSRRFTLASCAAALALSALAAPAGAAIKNYIYNSSYSTNPAAFNSGYSHYVDWSTTTIAGHNNYATMDINGSPNTKYLDFTSYAFSGGPSRCYSLRTSNTTPAGNNADTEIIVKNAQGVWTKLSDDPPLFGTYAFAHIFFAAGGNTRSNPKIRVNAYSESRNSDAFMLQTTWFTDNYVGCMDGIAALPGSVQPAAASIDQYGNVAIYRVK